VKITTEHSFACEVETLAGFMRWRCARALVTLLSGAMMMVLVAIAMLPMMMMMTTMIMTTAESFHELIFPFFAPAVGRGLAGPLSISCSGRYVAHLTGVLLSYSLIWR
jgi:hypothetical protein